ncbi:hypothetical protein A3L04_02760 [Thermococcus chitonophagus]|uniref:CRISPR-associated RAMP Cmr1 n=1 Tax=Thermococcus chitonophagus TaxID=54262 RepID=A0A160VQX6_9EURY|nr:type III-B CRISPR module RAMP protein Cmr1 [Thermococcus chitonophagus]ASJ16074.1 hypothetical protein A3L04_02760 [Thermococcus chitonophagus]CUX77323.1 CRISPR-associated RAMP Cmr1 [Thermococcus chitonophagus]
MYEVTFELENITPLFMHGADQSTAEFRAASVKGVMRWWFRALAGNYFGDNISGLKKAECRIFGCAESEVRKSLVTVVASASSPPNGYIDKTSNSWKNAIAWSEYVDYFFFSMLDKKRESNKIKIKSKSSFFPPQSRFRVILRSPDRRALELAEASLLLAIHLGGFGLRARRGAGSLKISKVSGDCSFDDCNSYVVETPDELRDIIETILEFSEQALAGPGDELSRTPIEGYPKYPILHPEYAAVFVLDHERPKDWIGALDNFGRWYLGRKAGRKFVDGFRFKFADYNLSHDLNRGIGGSSSKEKRYYLGLPLIYANYKVTVEGVKGAPRNCPKESDRLIRRRASGYWLSLSQFGDTVSPVVTVFAYQLYPEYEGRFCFRKKIKGERDRIGLITLENPISHRAEDNEAVVNFYREKFIGDKGLAGYKVWPGRV